MSRQDDIEKLITNYNRRLQKLREKEALFGISVDPSIVIEIEDIETEIEKLETELKKKENNHQELLDKSSIRQRYLEAIVVHERFNRWVNEQYVDENVRPLPMNVSPYDFYQSERQVGPRYDLIEVIENELVQRKYVLILGEPGAGKTTALERITCLYAHQGVKDTSIPLPIPINLNRYGDNLLQIIQATLNEVGSLALSENQVENLVANMNALILFDGLNELGNKRQEGLQSISNFMDIYSHHRYVLTCRTQDYHNDITVREAWEIQLLEERDVARYLETHLGDKGKQLFNHLRRDDHLLSLARNPLMLQMIKETLVVGGKFPTNRGDLYQSFVKRILWREEQKGDRTHNIPATVKEKALAQLGYAMQQDNVLQYKERRIRNCFVKYLQDWGEPYNWRELLKEVKINGLLRSTGSAWEFMHQSLQEFFAAYEIEENDLSDDILNYVIGKPEWNEVIWLLSGITCQSSKLITWLLPSDLVMAVKSVSQGARPNQAVLQLVIDKLGDMSKSENWAIRRICADLSEEICSPLTYSHLTNLLKDNNPEVRWGAVHAIRLIGVQKDVIEVLLPLLNDTFWVVQGETAQTLGELGAIEAIPELGKLLDSDFTYSRISATYALVKLSLSSTTPGSTELLESSSERISTLAHFATQVVGALNQTDFIRSSLKNASPFVKEAAMMLLTRAREFQAASEVALLLKDNFPSVRGTALGTLGRLQAYEYIPQICHIMLTDPNVLVRETAVNAIEWLYARDSLPELLQAIEDDSPEVRSVVARTFGRLRIVEARSVLKKLAQFDLNSEVRLQAIRALGFLGDLETINFLKTLANIEINIEVVQSIGNAIEDISRGERGLGLR